MARTNFLFPKETLAPTIISDTADRKFSCYPIVCYENGTLALPYYT